MDRRRPKKPRTVFKKRRNVGKPKGNISVPVCDTERPSRPTSLDAESTPTSVTKPPESASKIKLGDIQETYGQYEDQINENIIIDLTLLNNAISQCLACSKCLSATVEIRNVSNVGLGSKLEIFCKSCLYIHPFFNSNKTKSLFEINLRLVYGFRAIGKGCEAAKTFCGVMNLPQPPHKFIPYNEVLGSATEDVCFKSMKDAVEEAVVINEGNRDLPVAIDGTWQKRGHTSLNGAVTATSFDTGKVIDVSIMSKHCVCPNKLSQQHLESCKANYYGASGGMETHGAKEIFKNSVSAYNVRYTKYLGDGDSKGFQSVKELKPYGADVQIDKLECIGHIQKRMGTRLRKLKSDNKGIKLADGKPLNGKNRLSSSVIDQIQAYYGQAIRKSDTVEEMKQAIWALFYHKSSSDDNPQHGLCPKGAESWCKFQRSLVTGETYKHNNNIPTVIMEFIRPVFRSLSDTDLLKKCLHKKTQNPNESVNSVIWARLPKTGFVGIKTLHFGVYEAISTFNIGQVTKCKVLQELGVNIGKNTVTAMRSLDTERLRNSIRASAELKKKQGRPRGNPKGS